MLRRASASLRRPNGRQRQNNRDASLSLPLDSEDTLKFTQRVDAALRSQESFVYLDTSFLMWLIKISPASRDEFFQWLDDTLPSRVAVPTWSLHELYRHNVEKRIMVDLDEQLARLNKTAEQSFSTLWTLFDEPLNGASSAAQQREQARDTLRAVRTLTDRASNWKVGYERNAREVIEFANRRAVKGSDIFHHLSTIEMLADARFTGRVPPGFQDKRKKDVESEDVLGADVVVGSNRWGDLVFWQEVLDHARAHRVRVVVILTKDAKNDWRMAGKLAVHGDTDGSAVGVQPPHPMLSFEATRTASAQELVLLDQSRLADVMKRGLKDVTGFVAAAQPPSLPPPKTEAELRSEARERQKREQERVAEGAARASNLRFLDPTGLTASDGVVQRALYETRADAAAPPGLAEFETKVRKALGSQDVVDLLTSEAVANLGGVGLIAFGRRSIVSATDDVRWAALTADIASALETFPRATATFLYMGLLAGTYLDGKNKLLRTPNGHVAQKLFLMLDRDIARVPIEQIRKKSTSAAQIPLFIPSDPLPLFAEIKIDTELDQSRALRAVWINDHNLIIDVQSDPRFRLARRFGSIPLTPELLLDHIAELYVLPRRQLGSVGTTVDGYNYDEHMGLRAPTDVWRNGPGEKKS
ncbi:PIN-like domain-containing protein [Methylorubrum thiocyanatum]|uniref:PIN-like domain-containing protein n=1 Tax=Methylorubrum thiocyanatum TaxID=47958 RepID=UPI003F7CFC1D